MASVNPTPIRTNAFFPSQSRVVAGFGILARPPFVLPSSRGKDKQRHLETHFLQYGGFRSSY